MGSYFLVATIGLLAGCLSGIVGTGSSIMLLPVLVTVFGAKEAVPIMAVASLLANAARIAAWWREVDWRAVAAYALPGIPAAALGARTLLILPAQVIDVLLGLFFIVMIPGRRIIDRLKLKLSLLQLGIAGAFIGFLTGLVLSTGPLSVPVFLGYGLTKGAFLSTEAASALLIYASKATTFRSFGALPWETALRGAAVGASLAIGTFAGKAAVLRMNASTFRHLLDAMMVCAGLSLIWNAVG
ncbi:sulfite exporter TauE/SafE family protein [Mangrovicella endophytica]|uniref:sulfite exporter TauE/SafE family protein n=1 Tax=Mangrovicella endophytica TaxID=2066697 RepID=UPI000C9E7DA5|nr:sulfite exporter TauE/SafE family protein [Mangrovicella endophytica]